MASPRPDPERDRRVVGGVLYGAFMLAGATALLVLFLLAPLASRDPAAQYTSMGIGALCALPPLAIYLWIPRLIDRFDPEPWWALALVLGWGAIAACGIAATVNTIVEAVFSAAAGPDIGEVIGACVCAPIVEEGMKGLAVLGVFYFLRREFDGVVDGVIYATFAALGFAAVENVIYYGNAVRQAGGDALAASFFLRGVLAPWGHPLYTSMTGLGFGISRETNRTWLKWVAPLGGYACAMALHCVWNTAATISGFLMILMLPIWFAFVAAFLGLLVWLVVRKGRIIRAHLEDEVLIGNLTREELALVSSPFATFRARSRWGGDAGRRFVRAASRLGLSKWHAARAMAGQRRTVSTDWIVPLRHELLELRAAMSRALGRQLPVPQPWSPGAPKYPPQHPGAPHARYPGVQAPQYPGVQRAPYPVAQPAQYPGAPLAQYPGGQPAQYLPAQHPGAQPGHYPGAQHAPYPGAQPPQYPGAQPAQYPAGQQYPGAQPPQHPGAQPPHHPGARPNAYPPTLPGAQGPPGYPAEPPPAQGLPPRGWKR